MRLINKYVIVNWREKEKETSGLSVPLVQHLFLFNLCFWVHNKHKITQTRTYATKAPRRYNNIVTIFFRNLWSLQFRNICHKHTVSADRHKRWIKISYFLPVKTDVMRRAAPPCQDTHLLARLRAAAGRQLGGSSTGRQKIIRRHSLNDPITHAARRCRVRVAPCVSVNAEAELTPTQEIIKALLWLQNSSRLHLRTFCWCNNAIQLEVAWEILSHYHICVYLTCSLATLVSILHQVSTAACFLGDFGWINLLNPTSLPNRVTKLCRPD